MLIISLFKFFQWFSITFRIKSKNPYYGLQDAEWFGSWQLCWLHLLPLWSCSSVPATTISSLVFEQTMHILAFTLAVHLDIYTACSFISFSSPLKCQLIIEIFLTVFFEIAPYSPCPALPQSLFFIPFCFSLVGLITTWHLLLIIFLPSWWLAPWGQGLCFVHCFILSNERLAVALSVCWANELLFSPLLTDLFKKKMLGKKAILKKNGGKIDISYILPS